MGLAQLRQGCYGLVWYALRQEKIALLSPLLLTLEEA
jgi:hypothetical protein